MDDRTPRPLVTRRLAARMLDGIAATFHHIGCRDSESCTVRTEKSSTGPGSLPGVPRRVPDRRGSPIGAGGRVRDARCRSPARSRARDREPCPAPAAVSTPSATRPIPNSRVQVLNGRKNDGRSPGRSTCAMRLRSILIRSGRTSRPIAAAAQPVPLSSITRGARHGTGGGGRGGVRHPEGLGCAPRSQAPGVLRLRFFIEGGQCPSLWKKSPYPGTQSRRASPAATWPACDGARNPRCSVPKVGNGRPADSEVMEYLRATTSPLKFLNSLLSRQEALAGQSCDSFQPAGVSSSEKTGRRQGSGR